MKMEILPELGEQIRRARKSRKMTQPDLAQRLGRDRARISELERDLIANRLGKDRLTLLVEICDVMDLVPVLLPRSEAIKLQSFDHGVTVMRANSARPVFDDVFVDLSEDEDEDD